jgi:hypothetical protein
MVLVHWMTSSFSTMHFLDHPIHKYSALVVLQQQEKAKRQNYQEICEAHRESYHPFIAPTDGMLAPEATKILQHLAHITAHKQQKLYSVIVKRLKVDSTYSHYLSQSSSPLPQRIQEEAPPSNSQQHPQLTIRTKS